MKDFRHEVGRVIAESGQPLHVAKTQLGYSSIRITEEFYATYLPEFAVDVLLAVNLVEKVGGIWAAKILSQKCQPRVTKPTPLSY